MKKAKRSVREHWIRMIRGFSSTRLLVVGDVMVDRYYWGTVRRISPEAPVPVVDVAKESLRLGGAANVAHNVCAAGAKVLLCGLAGRDSEGAWLAGELDRLEIGREGIRLSTAAPTTVKSRVVAHNQQVVRFDREQSGRLVKADRVHIDEYVGRIWKDIDGVVISDYGKGVVREYLMETIRSLNRGRRKKPVVVDPKSSSFSLYRGATLITPNLPEAAVAAGIRDGKNVEISALGDKLLSRADTAAILITRGEEGMSVFEKGKAPFHIPTVAREVYDVTGAGDTVVGVIAMSLASGATLREAALLANEAAGIVVGEFGTVPITGKQLVDNIPVSLPD